MAKLLTEQNTRRAEGIIRKAMSDARMPGEALAGHGTLTQCYEHGRHWVTCCECGASWSVVDQAGPARVGFELIDEGDGFCWEG